MSVCVFTFSNINISETSGPIATNFYLKHHWVGGKDALRLMSEFCIHIIIDKIYVGIINRVGKKYRYAGIPRYFFGVVRTAAHLPVPRYSGVSIFSNRKP